MMINQPHLDIQIKCKHLVMDSRDVSVISGMWFLVMFWKHKEN